MEEAITAVVAAAECTMEAAAYITVGAMAVDTVVRHIITTAAVGSTLAPEVLDTEVATAMVDTVAMAGTTA